MPQPQPIGAGGLPLTMYQPMKIQRLFIATSLLLAPGILTSPLPAQEEAAGEATAGAAESAAPAKPEGPPPIPGVDWQKDGVGQLGDLAAVRIPDGFVFTGARGTQTLMQLFQNPVTGRELGYVAPKDLSWFVVFEFNDSGYVKDDEKESLDADALLKTMKKGQEQGNKMRKEKGWPELHLLGWAKPPFYNERTNNLEWATIHESEGQKGVNFNTRLLGRKGVMEATLVLGPDDLDSTLSTYQSLLGGFSYTEGNRYAEYKKGDKIAKYGLTALVAGGAAVVAAKSGLLGKLGKFIILIFVAIAAVLKKFWGGIVGLFGGKKEEQFQRDYTPLSEGPDDAGSPEAEDAPGPDQENRG